MPVAIITGASTGIGAALARELARRGHAVGLLARRLELLEELAQDIRAAGGKAFAAAADVTDRAATERAIRSIEEALGPCDLMIANAGAGNPTPAARAPVETILDTMRLNYDGVVHAVFAVVPAMLARKAGHVAVVSSVAGFRGLPTHGGYCASKSAVSTLFESLRMELVPAGVHVTTIHPGFVETPLTARNTFPMPFIMSSERAARIIADGLALRRADITFPWQLRVLMGWMLRWTPNWLWDLAVGGPARKYR